MVGHTASGSRQDQLDRRRTRIVAAARELAEAAGWEGVTTRRLADAIGFSQPVLYGHFPQGKSEIMAAVARVGFVELTAAMSDEGGAPSTADRLRRVVEGYLAFAARAPATYDAMFSLSTELLFADPETPHELRAGFEVLVRAVGSDRTPPDGADGVTAEVLWSTLHGMAMLERGGRVRASDGDRRIGAVLELFGERAR